MPMPVRVTDLKETFRTNAAGRVEALLRVSYMVGEHGPFTADFPKEGFSGERMHEALEQQAREIRRALGVPEY